jgi:hypothetical protein
MSENASTAAELAELRERRLIDKVAEEARKRVIAHYLTLAMGFTAAVSLVGAVSIPAWIETTARTTIAAKIGEVMEANTARIKLHAAELERLQQELVHNNTRQKALQDIAQDVGARLRHTLDGHEERMRELQGFSDKVANLTAAMAPLRAVDPASIVANTDLLQRLNAQVDALARQLDALSAGTTVAQATRTVVEQSRSIANEIAASQARNTVFVQFAGFTREAADTLRERLAASGYIVPPGERIASAAARFEVRFFHEADKTAAERLAIAATAAAKAAVPGEARTAEAKSLVSFAGQKPRPGTLELWYGPPR